MPVFCVSAELPSQVFDVTAMPVTNRRTENQLLARAKTRIGWVFLAHRAPFERRRSWADRPGRPAGERLSCISTWRMGNRGCSLRTSVRRLRRDRSTQSSNAPFSAATSSSPSRPPAMSAS